MADRAPPFLSYARAMTRLLSSGLQFFWRASPARMSEVTVATISPPNREGPQWSELG